VRRQYPEVRVATIRMEPDLYNEIKRHAEAEDRTISSVVRLAVRAYLGERGR
jgi:predicted transcriptional regulator